MDKEIKILVYDDHQLVTDAIQKHLKEYKYYDFTGKCHTIEEVKNNLKTVVPDVIIADVLSAEDAGLHLFEYLNHNYPSVKIVAFTSLSNDFVIDSLYKIGVSAVVNKKEKISTLLETVLNVFHDQKITKKEKNKVILTLSKKEKEIAEYLAKGYSAKEIAIATGTSIHTINNQKNLLLEKFSCTNSTELVVKLVQIGLIKIF